MRSPTSSLKVWTADLEIAGRPAGTRAMNVNGAGRAGGPGSFRNGRSVPAASFETEFKNSLADREIQVEGAVNKFELPGSAVEQPLQLLEQDGQGNLPHGDVEG